jgi:hypothetical protein
MELPQAGPQFFNSISFDENVIVVGEYTPRVNLRTKLFTDLDYKSAQAFLNSCGGFWTYPIYQIQTAVGDERL